MRVRFLSLNLFYFRVFICFYCIYDLYVVYEGSRHFQIQIIQIYMHLLYYYIVFFVCPKS
jgi:hypothetical protein